MKKIRWTADPISPLLPGKTGQRRRRIWKGTLSLRMGGRVKRGVPAQDHEGSSLRLLSGNMIFPVNSFRESFDRILGKEAEVCGRMQLTGVYKVFYPYKYYTAFSKSTPHRWLAFWGGAPNDAGFYCQFTRAEADFMIDEIS